MDISHDNSVAFWGCGYIGSEETLGINHNSICQVTIVRIDKLKISIILLKSLYLKGHIIWR